MKTINVYQSELNKEIPLEYVGAVKYIGVNDPLSFTDGDVYNIVLDKNKDMKIVDDTDEDYLYNLKDPNNGMGKLYYVDDPYNILNKYIEKYQ